MATPAYGATRLLRAAVLGVASMSLAAGAHAVGGGGLPTTGTLLLLAVPVGLLAVTLTSRRLRLPHLTAALGVSQLGLHHVLGLLGPTTCTVPSVAPHVGHGAGDLAGACTSGGVDAMAHMGSAGWPMLLAHVVATLLTATLLSRGEALLWQAVDAVLPRVPGRPVALTVASARPTSPATAPAVAPWVPGRYPSRAPPAHA